MQDNRLQAQAKRKRKGETDCKPEIPKRVKTRVGARETVPFASWGYEFRPNSRRNTESADQGRRQPQLQLIGCGIRPKGHTSGDRHMQTNGVANGAQVHSSAKVQMADRGHKRSGQQRAAQSPVVPYQPNQPTKGTRTSRSHDSGKTAGMGRKEKEREEIAEFHTRGDPLFASRDSTRLAHELEKEMRILAVDPQKIWQ